VSEEDLAEELGLVGERTTIELNNKYSLTGIIISITNKYVVLQGKHLFIIPASSIFIIDIDN